jgi:hypothetical protein
MRLCTSSRGLTIAENIVGDFVERVLRLQEQEPPHRRMKRLGVYNHRLARWALAVASEVATQ